MAAAGERAAAEVREKAVLEVPGGVTAAAGERAVVEVREKHGGWEESSCESEGESGHETVDDLHACAAGRRSTAAAGEKTVLKVLNANAAAGSKACYAI